MDRNFNRRLLKLEEKLRRDLEEVLCQEELLWFQKSRGEWIKSGDRNTMYYHASTVVKRNRNHLAGLRGTDGEWIQAGSLLKDHVNGYFQNLFREDDGCDVSQALSRCFPQISKEDWEEANARFRIDDIKHALFDIQPFKAPGLDGFHATFFQRNWSIIGLNL